jgi:Domain of Unknown Function (DUF1080)
MLVRLRLIVPAVVLAVAVVFTLPAAEDKKDEGWIQLFNGKDFTGWKIHPNPSGRMKSEAVEKDGKVVAFIGKDGAKTIPLWRVEDGMIVGGGPASHIFTERGDYENFHYRVEAMINDHGNSGQYFRTAFGPGFPQGYETQINATHGDPVKTGSIYPASADLRAIKEIQVLNTAPHKPNEWFTQEVIAVGPHITVLVNGKKTVDWNDPKWRYKKGHFALQGHDPGSIMKFRKVEVKELPATKE